MKKYTQRKKLRLKDFDYSSDNMYFVTCNVKGLTCCLGEIEDGVMHLNRYGEIVQEQLEWLKNQYSYIKIHVYVVMPNHIHVLIEIRRDGFEGKVKSLSSLMGAYKTTSSKRIHIAGLESFKWHRSFYDKIVRDQISYHFIYDYILNNPKNWKQDEYNPK